MPLEFIKLWRKPLDTEILQPLPALVHRPRFNPAQGAQLQKHEELCRSEKCEIGTEGMRCFKAKAVDFDISI